MSKNIVELNRISWKKNHSSILKNVSWQIRPGEHWALIGNNGSGKTSLLNILNGYIWPSVGSVEVLGTRFGTASLQEMRQFIGWVSSSFVDKQQIGHPDNRVWEVVVSGKYASIGIYREISVQDKRDAETALTQFHCEYLAQRPFASLSQGEKQRVVLARAMVRQPRLLILDEPCTGLDLASREELLSSLQALAGGNRDMTLIYVTHHIEEIFPSISHVLALAHGSVVKSGRKEEVLTNTVLSQTFEVPLQVSWQGNRPWIQVVNRVDSIAGFGSP